MNLKDKIKCYKTYEEAEKDYDNFFADWDYDVETATAKHKTGLKIGFAEDGEHYAIAKYPEWTQRMKEQGLNMRETADLTNCLCYQFLVLSDKNLEQMQALNSVKDYVMDSLLKNKYYS